MALMAKAYTPSSLVGCREFGNLISLLDPRIVNVSLPRISRNLIPLKYEDVESDLMKYLDSFP